MKLYTCKYYRTPSSKGVWDFVNAPSADCMENFLLSSLPYGAMVTPARCYGKYDPYFREITDFFSDKNYWK